MLELIAFSTLNGVLYGMLLFMLASGLTLVFSMMGVLNFAHVSFYMLGAYFGFEIERRIGFWPGLRRRAARGRRDRRGWSSGTGCAGCTGSAMCRSCCSPSGSPSSSRRSCR